MLIDMQVGVETFTQLDQLIDDLIGMGNDLTHFEEPLEHIKQHMVQQWAINFGNAGSIYGKWPALSSKWTIPERLAKGFGGRMLVRGGALQTHFVEENEAGQVNNLGILWNFHDAEGAYTVRHDEGYANPLAGRRSIPSRKLWDINDKDESYMLKEIDLYITQVIAKHFGG